MLFRICFFTIFLIYLIVLDTLVACEDQYNLLKIKSRLPRSNSKTNNEEFEKFFLKASKSVPRIGRRGSVNDNNYPDNNFNGGGKHQFFRYPFGVQPKRSLGKNVGSPFWSDIAQIYEYNPDLPNIMEYWPNTEQDQGDDPSVYDLNMRFKKGKNIPNSESSNKEIPEYRTQSDIM